MAISDVQEYTHLTDEEIDQLGRELDALRAEVEESRGAADAAYINRMITIQRSLAAAGRITLFASKWKPAFFAVKPQLVLKGGMIAMAAMGDPSASIPTPQPVHFRPMFGAYGPALALSCVNFVSQAAIAAGIGDKLGLSRRLSAVRGTRTVGKSDMVLNGATPTIDVDAQTYEVRADGVLLTCEPAAVLPLAQRYFLF